MEKGVFTFFLCLMHVIVCLWHYIIDIVGQRFIEIEKIEYLGQGNNLVGHLIHLIWFYTYNISYVCAYIRF